MAASSPLTTTASAPVGVDNHGLFAELHLHLGGAVLPHILYTFLLRQQGQGLLRDDERALLERCPSDDEFSAYFTAPRASLAEYVQMHAIVERLQCPFRQRLAYFVQRIVRGAVLFDNLAYMELRHTPYLRTDRELSASARIDQMAEVVQVIADAAAAVRPRYPLVFSQILCMHSTLDEHVNRGIVELAATMRSCVCGVDLAGPDHLYADNLPRWLRLFGLARGLGLRTTGHLFETAQGCHESLLEHLDRVGHGVQIPLRRPELLRGLARRGQCLEICPTTYRRSGTLPEYRDLKAVFARCFDAGVPIAICTDNGGLHNVRLPHEHENLLVRDVIQFEQMRQCQRAAFEHAFAWNRPIPEGL